MDTVSIAATERTPEVLFDFQANTYLIRGEAYPEDVNQFFGPLVAQLEEHLNALRDGAVEFTFEMIYFNSSTAKIFMMIFDLLDAAAEVGNAVSVRWLYEADDDNMQELGEEYGEDLEYASFSLVESDA